MTPPEGNTSRNRSYSVTFNGLSTSSTKVLPRPPNSTVSVSAEVVPRSSTFIPPKTTVPAEIQGHWPSTSANPTVSSSPPPVHPFANSTAQLELLYSDGIDVEEEAMLYDELSRSYEDETDQFTRSNTPLRTHSTKLIKSRPPEVRGRTMSNLNLSSSSSGNSKPTRHRRRPSSLPPESIFSADIFLADNTGSSTNSSFPLFARDVQISGWSVVGDGGGKLKLGKGLGKAPSVAKKVVNGGGAYVVYDCVILTREGTAMHILKRYTAFEELRDALKKTLPSSLLSFIPDLPPKAPFARFRPAFLDSRRKLLQFFLAGVLLHPEIGGREVVRNWVLDID